MSLDPDIPKFYSNCGEANLPVLSGMNIWLCRDGIRFAEHWAAFNNNIMDWIVIFPTLFEWISNDLCLALGTL